MPKFTRKHYQQFADTIRGCDRALFSNDELEGATRGQKKLKETFKQ